MQSVITANPTLLSSDSHQFLNTTTSCEMTKINLVSQNTQRQWQALENGHGLVYTSHARAGRAMPTLS